MPHEERKEAFKRLVAEAEQQTGYTIVGQIVSIVQQDGSLKVKVMLEAVPITGWTEPGTDD